MILIVDDSPEILDWLRDVVEKAGYYYDCAIDGRSALYKVQRVYYAMALIDIVLPDMRGDELARQIKSLPDPYRMTPLVAMTGGVFEDEPNSPLFIEVMHKPFLPRDLRGAIQRCARPPIQDLHLVR